MILFCAKAKRPPPPDDDAPWRSGQDRESRALPPEKGDADQLRQCNGGRLATVKALRRGRGTGFRRGPLRAGSGAPCSELPRSRTCELGCWRQQPLPRAGRRSARRPRTSGRLRCCPQSGLTGASAGLSSASSAGRNSWTASKSERLSNACNTTTAANTCGGIDGRPFDDRYMSANIDAGNNCSRCSAESTALGVTVARTADRNSVSCYGRPRLTALLGPAR
jgi:hypothetical protein